MFFRATRSLTPGPDPHAFHPPDPQQQHESATATLARRLVEGLARRGPLDEQAKERVGTLVHYGFGAAWGGLYGMLRTSFPALRSVRGVTGFSVGVWMASDNLMLPLFRLAAWPQRYRLRNHAYAIAAHLAYGAGVAGALAAMDHADSLIVLAALALARGRRLGRRAIDRTQALVPRDLVERPRRLAAAIARRARDARS